MIRFFFTIIITQIPFSFPLKFTWNVLVEGDQGGLAEAAVAGRVRARVRSEAADPIGPPVGVVLREGGEWPRLRAPAVSVGVTSLRLRTGAALRHNRDRFRPSFLLLGGAVPVRGLQRLLQHEHAGHVQGPGLVHARRHQVGRPVAEAAVGPPPPNRTS